MRIVENLIEINEPVVKAYLYENGVIDVTDWGLLPIDIISKLTIVLLVTDIKPLLEPNEGEWCFQVLGAGAVVSIVRYHRTDEVMYRRLGSFVALNPFTLQAEKDGILREIVELCEVVKTKC